MPCLPSRFAAVILAFAPLFFQRSWRHAEVLLTGAILTLGKRTVSSVLRIMGVAHERRFVNYHRVLNRAGWSARAASRVLLGLLINVFVPTGPVVLGVKPRGLPDIDDTIERRCGKCIAAKGIYRDPVLTPMRDGAEVVEDYRSVGLSLRSHPVAFLRATLQAQGMVSCADLAHVRDGRRIVVPGIVLVRQKPGSAKGIMFITIEDETGVANLILWPDRFARQRPLVLTARMLACHGRMQREGAVVHVITERLEDLSELLRSVGERDEAFPIQHGRGDGATHPAGPDPRRPGASAAGPGIQVPTRDFR